MALTDIWNDINCFFIDITSYTDAEKNAKKYKKLAEYLETKIKSCTTEYDTVKTQINNCYTGYTSNATSAKGKLKTTYDEKVASWATRKEVLFKVFDNALLDAEAQKVRAEELAQQWNTQVKTEEAAVRSAVKIKNEKKRLKEAELLARAPMKG